MLEYIERFRVNPQFLSNGINYIDTNTKSKDQSSQELLSIAQRKLRKATEAFRKEIINKYTLKSPGDQLDKAQRLLIKTTNEFCDEIQKYHPPYKVSQLLNTTEKPRKTKERRIQKASKMKFNVAPNLHKNVQRQTKHDSTRIIMSTPINSAQAKPDASFEEQKISSILNKHSYTKTSNTLDDKQYLKARLRLTKSKRNITKRNAKDGKRSTYASISNTMKECPKTKEIDHTAIFMLMHGIRKPETNAKKREVVKDKTIPPIKSDTLKPQEYETIENTLNTTHTKSNPQNVVNSEKLTVEREIVTAEENPNIHKSGQTLQDYYDIQCPNVMFNYWNPDPYQQHCFHWHTCPQWLNSMPFYAHDQWFHQYWSQQRQQKNKSDKKGAKLSDSTSTPKGLQSEEVPPETNIPNAHSPLNKTDIPKIKPLDGMTSHPIRYVVSSSDTNKLNTPSLTSNKSKKKYSENTSIDDMPLSELLEVVRSRNQSKKVKDVAMLIYGTKLASLKKAPKIPIQSDCKSGERGDGAPCHWDEVNKSRQSIQTEKKNQDCTTGHEHGPGRKCVSVKDIFIRPREILSRQSLPTISDGFISTKEYELTSPSLQPWGNEERIQGIKVFTRDFEPWCPLSLRPIRSTSIQTIPKNGSSSRPCINEEDDRCIHNLPFAGSLWGYLHSLYDYLL